MYGSMSVVCEALTVLFLLTLQGGINANGCQDEKPTYRILDEFGDERSILIIGGKIELTCHSPDATLWSYNHSGDTSPTRLDLAAAGGEPEIEKDKNKVLTASILVLSSGFLKDKLLERRITCGCSYNAPKKLRTENELAFPSYLVCSREEYKVLDKVCSVTDQLCVVDREGTSMCRKFDDCLEEDALQNSYKVCSAKSAQSPKSECQAVRDGTTKPIIQSSSGSCTQIASNFWQGNLTLWHNILFNDSYTFKPRNVSECRKQQPTCLLKFLPDQLNQTLPGNCQNGWTVSVGQIFKYQKTKMVCTTVKKDMWQFLLYNSNVTISYDPSGVAMCVWPEWLGENSTRAADIGNMCYKQVSFPYPFSQKSENFSIGNMDTVLDETTTLPTTTLPHTQEPTAIGNVPSPLPQPSSTQSTSETPRRKFTNIHTPIIGETTTPRKRKRRVPGWICLLSTFGIAILIMLGCLAFIYFYKTRQLREEEKRREPEEKDALQILEGKLKSRKEVGESEHKPKKEVEAKSDKDSGEDSSQKEKSSEKKSEGESDESGGDSSQKENSSS